MAISTPRTVSVPKYFRYISQHDTAIEWDKSFLHSEESVSDESYDADNAQSETELKRQEIDRKKVEYVRSGDASRLVLKTDEKPTYFYFFNPKEQVIHRKIRKIASEHFQSKDLKNIKTDFNTEILNAVYFGQAEGDDVEPLEEPRDIKGRLSPQFFQWLISAGISDELGAAVMLENSSGPKSEGADHSEKKLSLGLSSKMQISKS